MNGIIDFLSNIPEADPELIKVIEANQKVHNIVGPVYECDPLVRQQFSQNSINRLREVLLECVSQSCAKNPILIDIGTGTGLALDCSKNIAGKTVGFDVSRGMLEVAYKKGHAVHIASGSHLPLASEVADLVTIDSVLHHCYDIAPVISEAYRVLKPGGFLVTDWDPNEKTASIQRRPFFRSLLWIAKHVRYFIKRWKINVSIESFELAEYHRFHDEFIPDVIADILRKKGFKNIRTICHANQQSIHDLSFFSAPMTYKARVLILMLLGFTMKKNEVYDILMTISQK